MVKWNRKNKKNKQKSDDYHDFYSGYEGESEIRVVVIRDGAKAVVVSAWEAWLNALMKVYTPPSGEFTGFALFYHTDAGWIEQWTDPNPPETLQLLRDGLSAIRDARANPDVPEMRMVVAPETLAFAQTMVDVYEQVVEHAYEVTWFWE